MSVSVKVTTKSLKFRGMVRPLLTVSVRYVPPKFSIIRLEASRLMNLGKRVLARADAQSLRR